MSHAPSYDGIRYPSPLTGYYTGSDTIKNGMVLMRDYASTGLTADVTKYTANLGSSAAAIEAAKQGRMKLWIKPTLAGLLAGADIALVVNQGPSGVTGNGVKTPIELLPLSPVGGPEYFDAAALTDENCAVGDILGPIPGSYYLGRGVIPGTACFRVAVAADGSSTPTTVRGAFKPIDIRNFPDKFVMLDEHFTDCPISATADLNRFIFTANSGTAVIGDDLPGGVLVISSAAAATETSVVQNGESYSLAAGKSVFFRVRCAASPLDAAATDSMIGLAVYDVSPMASVPADQVIIRFDGHASAPTALLEYVKDGATGAVSESLGAIVSGTYYEYAFLVRNRAAGTTGGKKSVQVWKDGVQIAHTTTETEVADDEALTLVMSALGDADTASVLRVDRVTVVNNL